MVWPKFVTPIAASLIRCTSPLTTHVPSSRRGVVWQEKSGSADLLDMMEREYPAAFDNKLYSFTSKVKVSALPCTAVRTKVMLLRAPSVGERGSTRVD